MPILFQRNHTEKINLVLPKAGLLKERFVLIINVKVVQLRVGAAMPIETNRHVNEANSKDSIRNDL